MLGCTAVLTGHATAGRADDFTPSDLLSDAKLYFTAPIRWDESDWMFFGGSCLEPAVIDRMLSRPPASRPGALGYGCYEDTVATLEKALTPGPYILGTQFSAVDVYIGSQIGFGMMVKALEPRPAFQEYANRLQQRPAYRRFMEKTEKIAAEMKKAS